MYRIDSTTLLQYSFNSLEGPLVSDYRDFLLIYFKTVRRYNETKILRLYNTEFTLIDVYLKFSKLKSIKYLFNVFFIL